MRRILASRCEAGLPRAACAMLCTNQQSRSKLYSSGAPTPKYPADKMSSVLDEVLEGVEPKPEPVSQMVETKPAVVLGIDVGTSGVRAALFDEHGREIPGASTHTARNLATQSGFAEMDPEAAV